MEECVMDYEKILDQVKQKIDRRMEYNDPKSTLCQWGIENSEGKYEPNAIDLNSSIDWTRSFLTGAVALLYYHYKDEKYLKYLQDSFDVYYNHLYNNLSGLNHDMGFLYSLYAVAYYEVSGDDKAFKLAIKAADDLIKLYRLDAKILCGFGSPDTDYVTAIIDDIMNISLAMWGYNATGHPFYKNIVKNDIKTIRKYFMREDFSFRHAFVFEGITGEPIGERNYCGYSCGSIWARGQAWALSGNVNALASIDDEQSVSVIEGMINRLFENLGEANVPQWDMNCVGSKSEQVDTSAAAIIASALIKLSYISDKKFSGVANTYKERADKILETLATEYLADETKDGILTNAQCGGRSVGCVWGDYFFVEALMRKIHGSDTPDFWTGKKHENS